jgi:uncharacterized membrane protein
MALTASGFAGLAMFPGWEEGTDDATGSDIDIKPFPSRTVSKAVALTLFMASLLLFVSSLWQHVAAATLVTTVSSMSQGKLVGHVGVVAAVLIWLSLALVVLVFIGLLILIMSLHLLDILTSE